MTGIAYAFVRHPVMMIGSLIGMAVTLTKIGDWITPRE